MFETIAALILPAILCIAGGIFLFGKRAGFDDFLEGARAGLSCAGNLLPTLIVLIVGIRMLTASGLCDALSDLLAPVLAPLGIPAQILPLVLVRPFSGSAGTAVYSSLLSDLGVDSFPALCATVLMGSSDTFVYILCVYFSSAGVRRTRYAFPAAVAVSLFSLFLSCLVCRLWFKAGGSGV